VGQPKRVALAELVLVLVLVRLRKSAAARPLGAKMAASQPANRPAVVQLNQARLNWSAGRRPFSSSCFPFALPKSSVQIGMARIMD